MVDPVERFKHLHASKDFRMSVLETILRRKRVKKEVNRVYSPLPLIMLINRFKRKNYE